MFEQVAELSMVPAIFGDNARAAQLEVSLILI